MEISVITELIATVGFPILCVLALGVFIYRIWKQSAERETLLMAEITKSREVNEQFAAIIAKYNSELTEIKTDIREIKTTITKEDN